MVLETQFRNAMGLAMNTGFATLHGNGLCWLNGMVWYLQFYELWTVFLCPQAKKIMWLDIT